MGRPAGWMKQLTGRDAMRSPGAPSLRREVERQFWTQIATGITSEKAAEAVGVSQAVGCRWFRHRGGMPLFMSKPVSGRYLSFAEREEIGLLRAQDVTVRVMARRIGRSPSTVFLLAQVLLLCLQVQFSYPRHCSGLNVSLWAC